MVTRGSLRRLASSSPIIAVAVIAAVPLDITVHGRATDMQICFVCVPQGRVQIENGALSITALNLSDSGMYQCVAENKHGTIYYSAQLMVLGKIVSLLLPLRAWMSVFSDKKDARPFLQKSASKHS